MELLLQHVRDKVAKETRASGRSEDLINQVAPSGHEPAATTEPTRGERIVAAARWHVPRELGNGVPYEEADHGGEQERKRHNRSCLEGNDGESEYDVGRRRDMRDTLKHQFWKTKRIRSKLRVGIGMRRGLGGHLRHPQQTIQRCITRLRAFPPSSVLLGPRPPLKSRDPGRAHWGRGNECHSGLSSCWPAKGRGGRLQAPCSRSVVLNLRSDTHW